jgi:hypothetical protein
MLKIKKINLLLVLVIIANIKSKENNKKKINNFIYTKAIIATVFIGLLYKLYYKKNHFIQNEKKINTELNTAIEPHNDSTENIESATKSIRNSDFNTIILDQINQKSENISNFPSKQSVQKEEKTNTKKNVINEKELSHKLSKDLLSQEYNIDPLKQEKEHFNKIKDFIADVLFHINDQTDYYNI